MTGNKCHTCGSNVTGKICQYCGTLLNVVTSADFEREALKEFHRHLGRAEKSIKIRLLRSGFLPNDTEILIEAGMRCLPLIKEEELSDEPRNSVIQRLNGIASKLRIKAKKNKELKALGEFEKALKQHKTDERNYLIVGLIAFIVFIWFLNKSCN